MLIRFLLILALLAIVASLGVALFALIRNRGERTVHALTWRTLLSIALFLLLLLAYALGLIRPHAPGFLHVPAAPTTVYHQ